MTSFARRFSTIGATLRSNVPLTDDQIARYAPSVFAPSAHESRSARYAYIPTSQVLAGLRENGFHPVAVGQARARDEGKATHTKHMIRLRSASAFARDRAVGDSINEIVIVNSHDGSSAYHMMAGVFRLVCTNGMIAGGIDTEFKIQHSGKVRDDVVEGAHKLLGRFGAVDESRAAMAGTILTTGEQTAFARAALSVRYDVENPDDAPITAEQALTVRRREDAGNDTWSTLNRVQENLLRGGLRIAGRQRREKTREVRGIDGNVGLNRALWILAEELRKAHG
jgi:hypothetical protein